MDYTSLIFPAVVLLIGGRFVYGRLKYGSWTGSLLKGRIQQTLGEVEMSKGIGGTQKLTVYSMKNDDSGESFVGLVVSSRAALGASMQPFKLSAAQARDLATVLSKAIA